MRDLPAPRYTRPLIPVGSAFDDLHFNPRACLAAGVLFPSHICTLTRTPPFRHRFAIRRGSAGAPAGGSPIAGGVKLQDGGMVHQAVDGGGRGHRLLEDARSRIW